MSSLLTQGMVKVRERTRRTKERKDMEMKRKREKRIPEKVMEIINDKKVQFSGKTIQSFQIIFEKSRKQKLC